jgi:tRNA-2-methylthio-N6-dimethylallyladenosine synthase
VDDVPDKEKLHRFRMLEDLQEKISAEINSTYMNKQVKVLFEGRSKNRWRGRTPTNKLVFVESAEELLGQERLVKINWTGPWSMLGELD